MIKKGVCYVRRPFEEVKKNIIAHVRRTGYFPLILNCRGESPEVTEHQVLHCMDVSERAIMLPKSVSRRDFFTKEGVLWMTEIYWRNYKEYQMMEVRQGMQKYLLAVFR